MTAVLVLDTLIADRAMSCLEIGKHCPRILRAFKTTGLGRHLQIKVLNFDNASSHFF